MTQLTGMQGGQNQPKFAALPAAESGLTPEVAAC